LRLSHASAVSRRCGSGAPFSLLSRANVAKRGEEKREKSGIVDSLANVGNLGIPILPDQAGVLAKISQGVLEKRELTHA